LRAAAETVHITHAVLPCRLVRSIRKDGGFEV
jgi:hypothetical protein